MNGIEFHLNSCPSEGQLSGRQVAARVLCRVTPQRQRIKTAPCDKRKHEIEREEAHRQRVGKTELESRRRSTDNNFHVKCVDASLPTAFNPVRLGQLPEAERERGHFTEIQGEHLAAQLSLSVLKTIPAIRGWEALVALREGSACSKRTLGCSSGHKFAEQRGRNTARRGAGRNPAGRQEAQSGRISSMVSWRRRSDKTRTGCQHST